MAADKRYDTEELKNFLGKKDIQPQIQKGMLEKNGGQCVAVRHEFKSI